jgi:hypothetical protein
LFPEKLLQGRRAYGGFKRVGDLETIRGIGPKGLKKMNRYLTFGKPEQNEKPSTPAAFAQNSANEESTRQTSTHPYATC